MISSISRFQSLLKDQRQVQSNETKKPKIFDLSINHNFFKYLNEKSRPKKEAQIFMHDWTGKRKFKLTGNTDDQSIFDSV